MKLHADYNSRLACAESFPPNAVFDVEKKPDGSPRLMESVEEDVPVVKPVHTKEGFIMVPNKLDRKLVATAVQADRDAR